MLHYKSLIRRVTTPFTKDRNTQNFPKLSKHLLIHNSNFVCLYPDTTIPYKIKWTMKLTIYIFITIHTLCIKRSIIGVFGTKRNSGFIQKIAVIFQGLFKDFSRTTLDFQGQPTRNIISQIVQKCIFPVYSNKTLRLKLFASPTSLHFSVHLS